MKRLVFVCSFLLFINGVAFADYVMTVDPPARLLKQPNSSAMIMRIPGGEKLSIQDVRVVKQGMMSARWYKVGYQGNTGWISEYVTDGKVYKNDGQTQKIAPESSKEFVDFYRGIFPEVDLRTNSNQIFASVPKNWSGDSVGFSESLVVSFRKFTGYKSEVRVSVQEKGSNKEIYEGRYSK